MSAKDILSPPVMVLNDGRRYRINVIHEDFGGSKTSYQKGYEEEDLYGEDDEDVDNIEEVSDSLFKLSFHVPRVFYGGMIGQKGLTKKRIESETKTEVIIPGVRATGDSVVTIKGKSRKDVSSAKRRIDLVIDSLRKKVRPTHFTCVPTCTNDIKKSFKDFKQSVLSENYPGIDELLFSSADKLHITFSTCALLDDEERVKAGKILVECKELLANKPPIKVHIRGLEIMNDDPSSVSVLYACVISPNLQELADNVLNKYQSARLTEGEKRTTAKLHMTLMKTKNRSDVDPLSSSSFDARQLLKRYSDFEFGKFQVSEIHLSQMHTTSENGFYIATGIVRV